MTRTKKQSTEAAVREIRRDSVYDSIEKREVESKRLMVAVAGLEPATYGL